MTSAAPAQTHAAPSRKAAVYRLWGAKDVLLYIGSSYDPDARYRTHRDKPWGREIVRRAVTWYASREDAYQKEAAAILAECPKYNQYGKLDSPNSEEIRRRNEMSRLRERTLAEAARVMLAAERSVEAAGGPRGKAIVAGRRAKVEFLERTSLPAQVVQEARADLERWLL